MAQGRTFDDGTRARELFDAGKSCNAIAKELGVSPSTISGWAKKEGLSFDRSKTAAAVSAHRIDRAAVRADIIDRIYTRTQKILDRIEADTYTYKVATPIGVQVITEDNVPSAEEKNHAYAMNVYLERATRLEQVDGNAGEEQAKGILADLGSFLGIT